VIVPGRPARHIGHPQRILPYAGSLVTSEPVLGSRRGRA
jgi:hypothetical protein